MHDQHMALHKGGLRMAESSEIAEAFARLALMRDKGDAAARHLFELCTANPEMMRKAAEAFAEIAEIFTRWKGRARDSQRPGDRPALIHAVMRNDPEKVAALIKAGVWLDETDEGETALHWAVSRQHTEIVVMLLDAGANPNVPDNDGYTPLHDVAEMGDCPPARTMREALLAAGADPSRQEKNGRMPSELAGSTGYVIPSFQTTLLQSPSSSRAADDFATIRARMGALRRGE
jgi:ankyrin repeat protein